MSTTSNISVIYSLKLVREHTQAVRGLTNEKRNVIDVHAPNEEGGNRRQCEIISPGRQ
jgi:hypothetical protein